MRGFVQYLNNLFIPLLPETHLFGFKRFLWNLARVKIGVNTRICSSTRIIGSGKLTIGKNVWIGPQVLIACGGEIIIEDNVDVAPRVYIGTGSHIPNYTGERVAGEGYNGTIRIGAGSWLCTASVILPAKTENEIRQIGRKCIIGAGAVVVSDIKDCTTAVGIPAKKL